VRNDCKLLLLHKNLLINEKKSKSKEEVIDENEAKSEVKSERKLRNNTNVLNQMNAELKSGKAIQSYANEVKQNNKQIINNLFKEKKELEKQKRKQFYEKQKLLNFVNHFEFSTPLGSRVITTLFGSRLKWDYIQNNINSYEKFCKTHKSLQRVSNDSKFNNNNNKRICSSFEKKCFKSQEKSFEFYFNRRQRLEKYKRLRTGLNWKSRLLRLHCKPLFVKLTQIKNCVICNEELNENHSCHRFIDNCIESNDKTSNCQIYDKQLNNNFDSDFNLDKSVKQLLQSECDESDDRFVQNSQQLSDSSHNKSQEMDLCFDELHFEEELKRKALEDMKRAIILIPNRLNSIPKSGIFDINNNQNLLNEKEIQSSEKYTKNERICKINLDNSIVGMSEMESHFETCFNELDDDSVLV
jgi:hypothetical protein